MLTRQKNSNIFLIFPHANKNNYYCHFKLSVFLKLRVFDWIQTAPGVFYFNFFSMIRLSLKVNTVIHLVDFFVCPISILSYVGSAIVLILCSAMLNYKIIGTK